MGVIEDLARARDAFERREWAASYEALSRHEPATSVAATTSPGWPPPPCCSAGATTACRPCSAPTRSTSPPASLANAARCAFWLAMVLVEVGEDAVSSGWAARAERLLAEPPGEIVEHGYLAFHRFLRAMHAGQHDEAARLAEAVTACGERFGEREPARRSAISAQGLLMILAGRVPGRLRAAGRGDGRGLSAGEVSTRGRRRGLLHDDRGLPGDLRLRPGRAVDRAS